MTFADVPVLSALLRLINDPRASRILSITLVAIAVLVALALLAALRDLVRRHRRRDPRRLFTPDQKALLIRQAGGRCEHKSPLGRRCRAAGTQADHIVPWSRGGRTELSNGQLLCRRHNLRKSAVVPTRLYRWRLARRRLHYSV